MATKAALVLLFLLASLLPRLSLSGSPAPGSAYEELRSSGFPVGLLPANVLAYSVNRSSGVFAVDLDAYCRVSLPPDNHLASFSRRITGKLADRRITDLNGIRVRAFFRWWSITGIRSAGDDVVFEVGATSAKYPSRNFHESPQCESLSRRKADS